MHIGLEAEVVEGRLAVAAAVLRDELCNDALDRLHVRRGAELPRPSERLPHGARPQRRPGQHGQSTAG